ncbi:MAG: hypothetical protein JWS11_2617 [Cypionkella sp.]|nr:hypothetical protein [Cypionkella sp.]
MPLTKTSPHPGYLLRQRKILPPEAPPHHGSGSTEPQILGLAKGMK